MKITFELAPHAYNTGTLIINNHGETKSFSLFGVKEVLIYTAKFPDVQIINQGLAVSHLVNMKIVSNGRSQDYALHNNTTVYVRSGEGWDQE